MPHDIKKGLDAGFFRYLTKPIKVDEFMHVLDVALEFSETVAMTQSEDRWYVMLNDTDILNAGILVVDDQEANLQLLERMLKDAGYTHITTTQDPQAVCALHREHQYDLILLDLQMPVMDGFQVMEGLKAQETDSYLPVLVITAQPGHKLRALQPARRILSANRLIWSK